MPPPPLPILRNIHVTMLFRPLADMSNLTIFQFFSTREHQIAICGGGDTYIIISFKPRIGQTISDPIS